MLSIIIVEIMPFWLIVFSSNSQMLYKYIVFKYKGNKNLKKNIWKRTTKVCWTVSKVEFTLAFPNFSIIFILITDLI